jgi:hypothetical protein
VRVLGIMIVDKRKEKKLWGKCETLFFKGGRNVLLIESFQAVPAFPSDKEDNMRAKTLG